MERPPTLVVVTFGKPEDEALLDERGQPARHRRDSVGGHRQVEAERGPVGEEPGKVLEHRHAGHVGVLGRQGAVAIDEDDDRRPRRASRRRQRTTVGDLGAQPPHEPDDALSIRHVDQPAAVRQAGQRVEAASTRADHEEVHPLGRSGPGQRDGDGRQRGGRAAAGDAVEEQVPLPGPPPVQHLALTVGIVGQREGDRVEGAVACRRGIAARELVEIEVVGQRLRPRAPRPRPARSFECGRGRGDEDLEIGARPQRATRHDRARVTGAEREGTDHDRGAGAVVERAGDRRRLERDQLARPQASDGPARTQARQRRGGGRADDIDGVGRVLHAERDAEVRVGADLLAHRARRSLRGEHQVHAQAAAPLGDTDERVDEVGQRAAAG